jgi:tetratricopeptide (TPR) repeat protein
MLAMKQFLSRTLIGVALLGALAFAPLAQAAPPSLKQVESVLNQGDYARAQQMLTEVVQAYPRDARARYIYAQVLDRNGQAAEGLRQIEQARQLDPSLKFAPNGRFTQVERKIGADAQREGAPAASTAPTAALAAAPLAAPAAVPAHHGGGFGMIWLVLVLAGVAALLVWGVRRARRNEEGRADESRREQLRQATALLDAVRALKLDIRLSTQAGHEVLAGEAENMEAQLLKLVEGLASGSGASNPIDLPGLERLGSLSRQYESLKARVEGRPDPYPPQAPGSGQFADEADRFSQQRGMPAQQTVVVQQPGGGMGMGGGLLTGVLLGEMLGGGRERVIERDVLVDDQRRGGGNDGGVDFGQGGNDWNDGGGGGGVDFGGDDSGGWSDNS